MKQGKILCWDKGHQKGFYSNKNQVEGPYARPADQGTGGVRTEILTRDGNLRDRKKGVKKKGGRGTTVPAEFQEKIAQLN